VTHFAHGRAERVTPLNAGDWFRSRILADGTVYLRWAGLFEFLISANGRLIWYRRLGRATPEAFRVYLLGQVLSFSLLAFGVEPLHGTVVVVDGEAVAFLGDCGHGKSTLGAALLARGFPILTDDLVVVSQTDAGFAVQAGIPRIKLFPQVSREVLGTPCVGERMNPDTEKIVLPLRGPRAYRRPAPLRALYVLSDPALPGNRIEITPLSGAEAMLETVRNTFNTNVTDSARLARQFRFARDLVGTVPVKRLRYPRSLAALPDVCSALLADLGR
jgi:hypothetical protein